MLLYLHVFLFADDLPRDLGACMSARRVSEMHGTYLIERPQQPRTVCAEVPAFAPSLPGREGPAVKLISTGGVDWIYCCDGAGYADGALRCRSECE